MGAFVCRCLGFEFCCVIACFETVTKHISGQQLWNMSIEAPPFLNGGYTPPQMHSVHFRLSGEAKRTLCAFQVGPDGFSPGPSWAGPLWASLGPCAPGPCGHPCPMWARPLWALHGSLWAGPLWAPWALMGRAEYIYIYIYSHSVYGIAVPPLFIFLSTA